MSSLTGRPVWDVVRSASVAAGPDEVLKLPGFIDSPFAALVHTAARRCLGSPDEAGDLLDGRRDGTAIVLGSVAGDTAVIDAAGQRLAAGGALDPLWFHPAVPTTVLGVVAREYGITGPILCVSSSPGLEQVLADTAGLLLAAGDADQVLAIQVELAAAGRGEAAWVALSGGGTGPAASHSAAAALIRPAEPPGSPGGPAAAIQRHAEQ